jgi:hypothetical protein
MTTKKSAKSIKLSAWQMVAIEKALYDAIDSGKIEAFSGNKLYGLIVNAKTICVTDCR